MKINKILTILIVLFALAVAGVIALAVNYYTHDSYMVLNGDSEVNIADVNSLIDIILAK